MIQSISVKAKIKILIEFQDNKNILYIRTSHMHLISS